VCSLPSLHRAAGGKFNCVRAVAAKFKRVRALGGVALNLSQASKHSATESSNTYNGLGSQFAHGCPRRPALAARHSVGCSPLAVRVRFGRIVAFPCYWRPRQAGARWTEAPPSVLETTLSSSPIQAYTRSNERRNAVLPNPSIERTSTGLAHSTSLVYVPLRGPSRFRPAHVKR
jgi:hypothetical protein